MTTPLRPTPRVLVLLGLLVAAVAAAQEAPAPAPDPEPRESAEEHPSPFVAAGWCIVTSDNGKDAPTSPPSDPDDPEAPPAAEDNADADEEPGCDAGVGLALARHGRLAWVIVVGSNTVGTGIGWVPYQPKSGRVIAIAVGVVARYDLRGIHTELYPAIGATLSLGRHE